MGDTIILSSLPEGRAHGLETKQSGATDPHFHQTQKEGNKMRRLGAYWDNISGIMAGKVLNYTIR